MANARTNPWLVLVVLTTGFFMILLDTTIVNVAIPAMSKGLNATLDEILWVLNAYILVYAVLLIPAGRLGDLFGQRNMFALGLAVFTLASALCGFSQNSTELIAARIVQGVGGALLTPQTLAILTSIFPPERRGAAFGIWGGVAGLATIAGPTIGGALITYFDWPWIFFINVPIGIGAFIATFLIVPDLRPGRRQGWDLVGVALATAGLFGIVFGLIEGQRYNWGEIASYGITIPEVIGGGVALMIVFVVWEYFQKQPLVPLSLFEERNFAVTNWIAAAISFGMLSMFLPVTIYLQSVRGFSALTAGLTFAPMSLTSMIIAPFAGRLADRIGGKYILMTGISLFTVGASGVLNTTRQLGAAIGSAVVGGLLQNQLATALHNQAVAHAGEVPAAFRDRFIAIFSSASSNGFQIGPNQTGAALPAGLPPAVAAQLTRVAHDVFVSGYIDAMKSTLVVPVLFLAFTALTTLLIKRRRRPAAQAVEAPAEEFKQAAAG